MSERSFGRRYAEATGQTPARAIERLRLEAARRLLSELRLPLKRIAERCGFGSEETMRRSFLRLLSVTPHDYRARFSFECGLDVGSGGCTRSRCSRIGISGFDPKQALPVCRKSRNLRSAISSHFGGLLRERQLCKESGAQFQD